MILNHYSRVPLCLDFKRAYKQGDNQHKPKGLWLSCDDDSGIGWYEWCHQNRFMVNNLKHKTEVTIDTSNLLILDSPDKWQEFSDNYIPLGLSIFCKDWKALSKQFSGIAVLNYVRAWLCDGRGIDKNVWFAMWDCSSACIWDLSIIKDSKNVSEI